MSRISRRGGSANPGTLKANIELSHKFRFLSTGAFNGSIQDNFLLAACGVVSTTNLSASAIAQSVKLLSVEVWAPVSAQGAAVTVSLLWPTTGQNMGREVSDTSVSVSRVAHILSKPPKFSDSSFWNNGAGTTLFNLTVPTASIIDVSLSYVLNDNNSNPVTVTTVGGNVGRLTYGFLDSLTVAGAVLQPVALTPAP